mmetsp:Transcript_14186/g.2273  ORF Transcript_14186/g.2273 Transcript_14186/m.2273 type:complete len:94 (+) Transcript_14186:962-1243(+)
MKVIIKHLKEDDIGILKRAFMALDTEKSGFITPDQLKQALFRAGLNNAGEEVEKLVERISYINRGRLKYSDFIMATFDKQKLLKDDLILDAFR